MYRINIRLAHGAVLIMVFGFRLSPKEMHVIWIVDDGSGDAMGRVVFYTVVTNKKRLYQYLLNGGKKPLVSKITTATEKLPSHENC